MGVYLNLGPVVGRNFFMNEHERSGAIFVVGEGCGIYRVPDSRGSRDVTEIEVRFLNTYYVILVFERVNECKLGVQRSSGVLLPYLDFCEVGFLVHRRSSEGGAEDPPH